MYSIIKIKTNRKFKFAIIIFIIILVLFLLKRIYYSSENFEDSVNTILSNWDNGSGFYSEMGFKLNHYLYCRKYNMNFRTNSDNWPYKYKNGWLDYFEDNQITTRHTNEKINTLPGCCTILEQFPLRDYVAILPEFYKYNTSTTQHIQNVKNNLGLTNGEYGAVYIRRGDKLVDEAQFVHGSKFMDILLDKYPDCSTVFVQTDDYNSYLEVIDYIKGKNLNIKALTLCPETNYGSIANNSYLTRMSSMSNTANSSNKQDINENIKYMEKITKNLAKPISEMTPDEKKEHTLELITSVDICANSKICVCDLKSNVSRFIKIAHKNFDNVIDVNGNYNNITLDSAKCPSYDYDSVHNV